MLSGKHPRVLLRSALVCLGLFGASGLPFLPDPGRWADAYDGGRGAALGMAIGLLALAGMARQRGQARH
jgi:hypothetical protein